MLKKITSYFLAFVLLMSAATICIPAITTEAATVSNQSIINGLDKLREKFPDGKYWNHYGSSTKNLDKWTNTPCPSGHYLNGVQQCNGQCDGFARKLGLDLFGVNASKWQKKTTLDNLHVGDIIRYRNRHTIMVVGFTEDEDTIIIADCNWDTHCGISWDREFSISRYIYNDNYYVLHYQNNNFTREAYLKMAKPSVSISPKSYVVPVGGQIFMDTDIKATVTDPLGIYGSSVYWSSSDYSVADIYYDWSTGKNYIVGLAPGTVTLTAQLYGSDAKATCTITVAETDIGLYRIAGTGRVETAVEISKVWESSTNVVLASGENFADSLVGVPLAVALDNAPILLTRNPSSGLEQVVIDRIKELGASNIYILGGTFSVSNKIANQLTALGLKVERISGPNRYATSVEIAKELDSITGGSSEIFVASGENYPDSLSVSSIAGILGAPIIYSSTKGVIPDECITYLKSRSTQKATVIGGELSIATAAETTLKNCGISSVTRISGSSRFDTCSKVLTSYKSLFADGVVF